MHLHLLNSAPYPDMELHCRCKRTAETEADCKQREAALTSDCLRSNLPSLRSANSLV